MGLKPFILSFQHFYYFFCFFSVANLNKNGKKLKFIRKRFHIKSTKVFFVLFFSYTMVTTQEKEKNENRNQPNGERKNKMKVLLHF